MKAIAYRAGLVALGALVIFIIDATMERLLFPSVSIIAVRGISIVVAAALTFFFSTR